MFKSSDTVISYACRIKITMQAKYAVSVTTACLLTDRIKDHGIRGLSKVGFLLSPFRTYLQFYPTPLNNHRSI